MSESQWIVCLAQEVQEIGSRFVEVQGRSVNKGLAIETPDPDGVSEAGPKLCAVLVSDEGVVRRVVAMSRWFVEEVDAAAPEATTISVGLVLSHRQYWASSTAPVVEVLKHAAMHEVPALLAIDEQTEQIVAGTVQPSLELAKGLSMLESELGPTFVDNGEQDTLLRILPEKYAIDDDDDAEGKPCLGFSRMEELFAVASGNGCMLSEMGNRTASLDCIPFQYPDDGCWARAHAMWLSVKAVTSEDEARAFYKVWLPSPRSWGAGGGLQVNTDNHPRCRIGWRYHVALACRVVVGVERSEMVFDPSLFDRPVSFEEWRGAQTVLERMPKRTSCRVYAYVKPRRGRFIVDEDGTKTRRRLDLYRKRWLKRVEVDGPPPYRRCSEAP